MSKRLPFAMIHVAQNDIEPDSQEFLREWARELDTSVNQLLKRIMLAGVLGQLYAEKIPKRTDYLGHPPDIE